MSDKPDWAEELAAAIIPVWSEAIDYREPIAAALRKMIADKEAEFIQRERKAKADGVKAAAEISLARGQRWEDRSNLQPFQKDISDETARIAKLAAGFIAADLHTLADKIEKGES